MRNTTLAVVFSLFSVAAPAYAQTLSYATVSTKYDSTSTIFGQSTSTNLEAGAQFSMDRLVGGVSINLLEGTFIAPRGDRQLFVGLKGSNLSFGASLGQEGKVNTMTGFWGLWLGAELEGFSLGIDVKKPENGQPQYTGVFETQLSKLLAVKGYFKKTEGDPFSQFAISFEHMTNLFALKGFGYLPSGDDVKLVGLSANYNVSDKLALAAGIGQWNFPGGSSNMAGFLGASYMIAPGVTGEALVKKGGAGSAESSALQLNLKFELGKSARVTDRIYSDINDMVRSLQ